MKSDRLYHYTCIEAVTSIIKDRQLLLTNISYLTDSREFIEGLEVIKDVYSSVINSADLTSNWKMNVLKMHSR